MGVKRTILAAAAAIMMAVPASAAVVQSQTRILDSNGDTLRYRFDAIGPTTGYGKLTIRTGAATTGSAADAGIDLDGEGYAGGQESFRIWLEGGLFGEYTCGGRADGMKLDHTHNGAADCEFELNIWLKPNQMAEIVADGIFTFAIRFGAGVGHHGDGDELIADFRYYPEQVVAAPLPASAALLLGGLGLAGFASRRRKSKS